MSPDESVLAICVNWNGGRVLLETVRSLLECRPGNLRFQVMVADNASSDDSLQHLEREYPEVEVKRLPSNRGYGGALNAAVEAVRRQGSESRYYLFLNNDIRLRPGCIEALLDAARRLGRGAYGPRILRDDDSGCLEAAWGEVDWSHVLARFHGIGSPADEPPWNQERRVQVLLGSAFLIGSEAFLQAGGFDPRFFMYHEEVDLFFRLDRLGIPAYYCPEAAAVHRGGYSTRSSPHLRTYWIRRNTILFLRKHSAGVHRWWRFAWTLGGSLVLNSLLFRWGRLNAILRGVRDGWKIDLCEPPATVTSPRGDHG